MAAFRKGILLFDCPVTITVFFLDRRTVCCHTPRGSDVLWSFATDSRTTYFVVVLDVVVLASRTPGFLSLRVASLLFVLWKPPRHFSRIPCSEGFLFDWVFSPVDGVFVYRLRTQGTRLRVAPSLSFQFPWWLVLTVRSLTSRLAKSM